MAKPKKGGVWGIDIGQCALKALRLEVIDGKVTATAFDYVEHSKILSQPDADPDALTKEALEKFLSRNSMQGDQVAISVPGQSGLARFVKLPPVEEKKIADIVKFEAKQQIPFPLEEVIWDFQKIGQGVVTDGFAMDTEIGLFAMKRDMVSRFLQHFKDVKVEVHVVQMAPLSLCNYISYDLLKKSASTDEDAEEEAEKSEDFKKRCVVALDIGTDNSNLVITDGERIIWQRPIPQGGNHFTRALTKELKLTFAKAEHIKRNATKSPDLKKILSALKPVLTDFVGEVQRSLGYFTNTHRDANIAYMMGLGNAFRLPGLQKFLSEKLQIEVRKLQKLERMAGDTVTSAPSYSQNVLSFAVAYGLALQGLKKARLQTNLLPPDIQTERMVRAKKPLAVSAAAALLVGATAMAIGYALQYRAVAAPSIEKEIADGNTFSTDARSQKTTVEAKESAVKQNEEAVRSIVAGQDERINWILLNRFVDDCLPVPAMRFQGSIKGPAPDSTPDKPAFVLTDKAGRDHTFPVNDGTLVGDQPGRNADLKPGTAVTVVYQPDPGAMKYWITQEARKAYQVFLARQTGAKGGEGKSADEGVDALIQVNLEALDARFSSDLKAVYDKIGDARILDTMGLDRRDKNKLQDAQKGWVVEIRGYTYNRAGRQFIVDTLLRNLQTKPVVEEALPGPAGTVPPVTPGTAATPPAPVAPATPAAPGSTSPAKTEPEDPIINKVSHAILYSSIPDDNPDPGYQFKLIGTSVLPSLVVNAAATGAASAGGSGGGMGSTMGAGSGGMGGAGGGADSWVPLLGSGKAGAAGGMGTGGGTMAAPRSGSSGGMGTGASMAGGTGVKPGAEKAVKGPTRTEFVILFIWREPLPSDDRMATQGGATTGMAAPVSSPSAH